MKRSLFGFFIVALTAGGVTNCLASERRAMPGGVLYGPATAGYTYLANLYPGEWRSVKLSAAHTYRIGVVSASDLQALRKSSSPEYRALRKLGVVPRRLYVPLYGRHRW